MKYEIEVRLQNPAVLDKGRNLLRQARVVLRRSTELSCESLDEAERLFQAAVRFADEQEEV